MPSQMNKQRIKKITRLLRGPILIVLFLAAVACNAESTAIPVPAPVPTEVPTATAEPTAPSDPTAVKGGGKTYHCGEEKVYHRGNG